MQISLQTPKLACTRSVTGSPGSLRRDDERKDDFVAIDERNAGAVVMALRRRVEHLDGGDILGAGEIETGGTPASPGLRQ